MLIVLKIPVVYLCAVVWWAIRAEPDPLEGAALPVAPRPEPPACDWRRTVAARRRDRRPPAGPKGSRLPGRAATARGRVLA